MELTERDIVRTHKKRFGYVGFLVGIIMISWALAMKFLGYNDVICFIILILGFVLLFTRDYSLFAKDHYKRIGDYTKII